MSRGREKEGETMLTDAAFAPIFIDAEHGDVASVRDVLVHALLAHDNAYRDRRACRYGLEERIE